MLSHFISFFVFINAAFFAFVWSCLKVVSNLVWMWSQILFECGLKSCLNVVSILFECGLKILKRNWQGNISFKNNCNKNDSRQHNLYTTQFVYKTICIQNNLYTKQFVYKTIWLVICLPFPHPSSSFINFILKTSIFPRSARVNYLPWIYTYNIHNVHRFFSSRLLFIFTYKVRILFTADMEIYPYWKI